LFVVFLCIYVYACIVFSLLPQVGEYKSIYYHYLTVRPIYTSHSQISHYRITDARRTLKPSPPVTWGEIITDRKHVTSELSLRRHRLAWQRDDANHKTGVRRDTWSDHALWTTVCGATLY